MTAPDSLPSWECCMVPLLRVLSDGRQRTRREAFAEVADLMRLSDEQRSELFTSGQSKRTPGWAGRSRPSREPARSRGRAEGATSLPTLAGRCSSPIHKGSPKSTSRRSPHTGLMFPFATPYKLGRRHRC